MTKEEFIDNIRPAFPLSADSLSMEVRHKDLSDWNSMAALVMITIIGQCYDVDISPIETIEANTFEDIYNLILQRM